MAGITRLSAQKTARLTAAQAMPMTPAGRFSGVSTAPETAPRTKPSRAKSIPGGVKGKEVPQEPPRAVAGTQ